MNQNEQRYHLINGTWGDLTLPTGITNAYESDGITPCSDEVCEKVWNHHVIYSSGFGDPGDQGGFCLGIYLREKIAGDGLEDKDLELFMASAMTAEFYEFNGLGSEHFPSYSGTGINSEARRDNSLANHGFPKGLKRMYKWIKDRAASTGNAFPTHGSGNGKHGLFSSLEDIDDLRPGDTVGASPAKGMPVGNVLFDKSQYKALGTFHHSTFTPTTVWQHYTRQPLAWEPEKWFMANAYGTLAQAITSPDGESSYKQGNYYQVHTHKNNPFDWGQVLNFGLLDNKPANGLLGKPHMTLQETYEKVRVECVKKVFALYEAWCKQSRPLNFSLSAYDDITKKAFWWFATVYDPLQKMPNAQMLSKAFQGNPGGFTFTNFWGPYPIFPHCDHIYSMFNIAWLAKGRNWAVYKNPPVWVSCKLSFAVANWEDDSKNPQLLSKEEPTLYQGQSELYVKTGMTWGSLDTNINWDRHIDLTQEDRHPGASTTWQWSMEPTYVSWSNSDGRAFIQAVANAIGVFQWGYNDADTFAQRVVQYTQAISSPNNTKLHYHHKYRRMGWPVVKGSDRGLSDSTSYDHGKTQESKPGDVGKTNAGRSAMPHTWGYEEPWAELINSKYSVCAVMPTERLRPNPANMLMSYNQKSFLSAAARETFDLFYPTYYTRQSDSQAVVFSAGFQRNQDGLNPFVSCRTDIYGATMGGAPTGIGWKVIGLDYLLLGGTDMSNQEAESYINNAKNYDKRGYKNKMIHEALAQLMYRNLATKPQLKMYEKSGTGPSSTFTETTLDFSGQNVAQIKKKLARNKKLIRGTLEKWYKENTNSSKREYQELVIKVPMMDKLAPTYLNSAAIVSREDPNWRAWVDKCYDDYTVLWKDMEGSRRLWELNKQIYEDVSGGDTSKSHFSWMGPKIIKFGAERNPNECWYFPWQGPPVNGYNGWTYSETLRHNPRSVPFSDTDNTKIAPIPNPRMKFSEQTAKRSDANEALINWAAKRWNRWVAWQFQPEEFGFTAGPLYTAKYEHSSEAMYYSADNDYTKSTHHPMGGCWSGTSNVESNKRRAYGYNTGCDPWLWWQAWDAKHDRKQAFKRYPQNDTDKMWDVADIVFPSTDIANDIVMDTVAANAATVAIASLGVTGTQAYLNQLMATIIYKEGAALEDSDFEVAQAKAQGKGSKIKSPVLQTFTLSEDEVERRQDFFEQCALLMNMEKFVSAHHKRIQTEMFNSYERTPDFYTPHGKRAYGERFWMVQDVSTSNADSGEYTDQNSMINKFMIPHQLGEIMNIHPSVVSMLTPKLRIYKVFNAPPDSGQKLNTADQVEFEFDPRGLDGGLMAGSQKAKDPVSRLNEILGEPSIDRGSGAGIKSFDFSFEGTSPATARNDITATLVIYFQNFNDFFRERMNSQNQKYKFVDLVLYPGHNDQKQKVGYGKASKNQYDPSYYRIRADVGWVIPDNQTMTEIDGVMGIDAGNNLANQLEKINKSFYLNMVDHDISLKEDGTVEIKISYRAYIESLLKSNRMDALESSEIREKREEKEKKINKAREEKCSAKEILALKAEFLKQEEAMAALAQQSIMKRMFDNQRIFWAELEEDSKMQFEINGFFTSRPYFYDGHKLAKQAAKRKFGATGTQEKKNEYIASLNGTLDEDGLINYNFVEEDIGVNQRVHYFFMGDLVYTILDCLYSMDDPMEYRDATVNNIKLILGSFDYYDFDGVPQRANIANIPISVHYFVEWYTQNVVKPKRVGYPVVYFIRDLCNQLVGSLFSNLCRRTPLERKIRFNTGNFIASGLRTRVTPKSFEYIDRFRPLSGFWDEGKKKLDGDLIINLHDYYIQDKNPPLPLISDSGNIENIKDQYNYFLIYAMQSPTVQHPGRGNPLEDAMRGVQHFHVGSRTGITKKISFAKTDIQYLRESRFINQGDQGLLQLGAVYKVSIDMVGNTIWYPGMEIYVNPLGIGGTEFGSPVDKDSTANALGFGGYHLVTRVKNSIAAGKFNTTVEAQFHYSGNPDDQGQRLGMGSTANAADIKKIDEEKFAADGGCGTMVNDSRRQTTQVRAQSGVRSIESN